MWNDVGIIRDARGLERAGAALIELRTGLSDVKLDENNLVYNLGWHDWLNLENLLLISDAVRVAAIARENSRGAHFRTDHPDAGDLSTSRYTKVSLRDDVMNITTAPVEFSRVRPDDPKFNLFGQ